MNIGIKKLIHIFLVFVLIYSCSGCVPAPEKSVDHFLSNLRNGKYADAKSHASYQIQKQIDVIEQDKHALFNGQQWEYGDITVKGLNNKKTAFYTVNLNDGSKIEQRATLIKVKSNWLIDSIRNAKITYSNRAIKARTYAEYGDQMLIAPFDIETISPSNLKNHVGQFIMVSGSLCDFTKQTNRLIMRMGADSSKPLLWVTIVKDAEGRALKDYQQFIKTAYMHESPSGDTFTAIGILIQNKNHFRMEISEPQNIIIGYVLRIEKN